VTSLRDRITEPAGWLASDDLHGGIVVSSRVRLARNLADEHFRRELDRHQEQLLVERLMPICRATTPWRQGLALQLAELSQVERKALLERRLISREMVGGKHPGGAVVSPDERSSLMVNEEDHLRIQAISPGLAIDDCLASAVALDRQLETQLQWATHPRFGYLTSCPTNTGTGMRPSVMLHLPALAETKEIASALRGITKLHLTVRGLFGEGSEASGHYYQVSNQRTLGTTEEAIATTIEQTVTNLVEFEQLARQAMLKNRRSQLEDRVFRAWGILSEARRLSGNELIEQLSWFRLGLAVGQLPDCSWSILDRIFLQGQAAHLELLHPEAGDAERRDEIRAGLVRTWLRQAAA
jgi:protein arginine kinase